MSVVRFKMNVSEEKIKEATRKTNVDKHTTLYNKEYSFILCFKLVPNSSYIVTSNHKLNNFSSDLIRSWFKVNV